MTREPAEPVHVVVASDVPTHTVKRKGGAKQKMGMFQFSPEYKDAVNDCTFMFLSSSSSSTTSTTATKKAPSVVEKYTPPKEPTADEVLMMQLVEARKHKRTMPPTDVSSGSTRSSSTLSASNGLDPSLAMHFFPVSNTNTDSTFQEPKVVVDTPIPAMLPRNTKSRQDEPSRIRRELIMAEANNSSRRSNKSTSSRTSRNNKSSKRESLSSLSKGSQREQPEDTTSTSTSAPYMTMLPFGLGALTACVSPNMDNVVVTNTTPEPAAEKQQSLSVETRRDLIKIKREIHELKKLSSATIATATTQESGGDRTSTPSFSVLVQQEEEEEDNKDLYMYPTESRRDILKIKRNLFQLRKLGGLSVLEDNSPKLVSALKQRDNVRGAGAGAATTRSTTTALPERRSVRFTSPLVTQVTFRPRTRSKDRGRLFFCPDELDELEADRETTEGDQYECIAENHSSDMLVVVSVAHKLTKQCSQDTADETVLVQEQLDDDSASDSDSCLSTSAKTE